MKHLTRIILAGILITGQTVWAQPPAQGNNPEDQKRQEEFRGRGKDKAGLHKNGKGKEFMERKRDFHNKIREENEAFFESLKNVDPAERADAIKKYIEERHQQRLSFQESWKAEKAEEWKAKMEEKKALQEKRHQEHLTFITETMADETLSDDEKLNKIKLYREDHRAERKDALREKRRDRNKVGEEGGKMGMTPRQKKK